jgi:hypothetical protein
VRARVRVCVCVLPLLFWGLWGLWLAALGSPAVTHSWDVPRWRAAERNLFLSPTTFLSHEFACMTPALARVTCAVKVREDLRGQW